MPCQRAVTHQIKSDTMLKRIVAITFVALLSLALADMSIAKTKKQRENQDQMNALKGFNNALKGAGQVRTAPQQPGTGPKGTPPKGGAAGRK